MHTIPILLLLLTLFVCSSWSFVHILILSVRLSSWVLGRGYTGSIIHTTCFLDIHGTKESNLEIREIRLPLQWISVGFAFLELIHLLLETVFVILHSLSTHAETRSREQSCHQGLDNPFTLSPDTMIGSVMGT